MSGLRSAIADWRLRRRLASGRLLRAFARLYPRARFVEVGANDGDQHDHLRPHIRGGGWRGVMAEPVPYVFERLRSNYGDVEGVALANVAVGVADGDRTFYRLVEPSPEERDRLPDWYDGVGSFSLETVRGHAFAIPDIEARIVGEEVPTLTLDSLCERYGLDGVDLLVIDAEGYDAELLASVDLARHAPRLVAYEHFHLTSTDREACRRRVQAQGYETLEEGFDTWCIRTDRDDDLTRLWRRLKPAVAGVSAEGAGAAR